MNTRGYELGYDAAVCIQKYEPWIIEAYNTSLAPPSILRIVEKWDGSTSLSPGGNIQGPPIAGTRYLNTSSKVHSFKAALINGGLKLVRSNEDFLRDYVPTPTVSLAEPQRAPFILTSTHSTGRFFHRRQ